MFGGLEAVKSLRNSGFCLTPYTGLGFQGLGFRQLGFKEA